MLSIIIPILNESKSGYLAKILQAYAGLEDCEIICVDGGSQDDSCDLARRSGARLIETDISPRAGRLNEGIKQARYPLILLHHPRSLLEVKALQALIQQATKVQWGAFTHRFDLQHPLLRFTSWYSNHIRGDRRGIYYLDHCLFAQKQLLLDVGLLPEVEIFEDTELCLRLSRKVKGIRLPFISQTSAIRFQTFGIYRQAFNNQKLKWMYYFKGSDRMMNQTYEQQLQLNSQYEQQKPTKKQPTK